LFGHVTETKNMKIKRFQNKILLKDFHSPDVIVASFEDDLIPEHKNHFINEHNCGTEVLEIYEKFRCDLHISTVQRMLEEMEKVFINYDQQRFEIKRKTTSQK
jgi:hypothetical protein